MGIGGPGPVDEQIPDQECHGPAQCVEFGAFSKCRLAEILTCAARVDFVDRTKT